MGDVMTVLGLANASQGGGGMGGSKQPPQPQSSMNLGVPLQMPQIQVPTSVTPLSEQIATMRLPTLSNPMDTLKQGPSLGVDTNVTPAEKSDDSIEDILKKFTSSKKRELGPALQWMNFNPPQAQPSISQQDLITLLQNLSGGY